MSRKDKKRDRPAAGSESDRSRPSYSARLTPVDIQQKEFRLSMRGYNEHEVDEFLDHVTEEVARLNAEVRRAQEDLEHRRTLPVATDATMEAEAILDKAREEAARILADADRMAAEIRARAGEGFAAVPGGASPSDPLTGRFLAREKEFLQGLASLISRHAEAVKEDVRTHREATHADPAPEIDPSVGVPADAEPDRLQETHDPDPDPDPDPEPERASPEATLDLASEPESPPEQAPGDPGGPSAPTAWDVRPPGMMPTAALDIADLSPVPEAPRVEVPEPDEDTGQDRSIRELFWGED